MSADERVAAYMEGAEAFATEEPNPYPEGSDFWHCWELGWEIEREETEDEDDAYCERCGAEDESCTVVWEIESAQHAHKSAMLAVLGFSCRFWRNHSNPLTE